MVVDCPLALNASPVVKAGGFGAVKPQGGDTGSASALCKVRSTGKLALNFIDRAGKCPRGGDCEKSTCGMSPDHQCVSNSTFICTILADLCIYLLSTVPVIQIALYNVEW